MVSQQSAIEGRLIQWLTSTKTIAGLASDSSLEVQPLSGDAGFRQYFRINNFPDLLAVYAPTEQIDSQKFIDLVVYLREEGIHAPQVFEYDLQKGFLLIENFGDTLLLSVLNSETADTYYGESLLTLLRLQQSPAKSELIPPYNEAALRKEMELFPEWFVSKLLGHDLTDAEHALLEDTFKLLISNADEQPHVFVHRDYHSRNLIVRKVGPPGVIDFQDAVWGPITYDLVSLLKDCYVRWPSSRVNQWVRAYGSMIASAGLMLPVSENQFQRWFDLMGLQRHLKVLGIFARLFLRDNKSAYLNDLPLVLRYVLETTENYSELKPIHNWIKSTLVPLCEQQSWYQDYLQAGYSPDDSGSTK